MPMTIPAVTRLPVVVPARCSDDPAAFLLGLGRHDLPEEPVEFVDRRGLTLPHRQNGPPDLVELFDIAAVSGPVGLELPGPEVRTGSGRGAVGTADVSMPEAAVNEDRELPVRKDDVRSTRKLPNMDVEP